jgi:hypothetical protein
MLKVTATIDAPAAVAWALLTDTHAWPHWGPSVRKVDAPARFIAAGTRGRVQTTPGPRLPFEITEWQEGTYWRWRVAGVAATGHRVTPTGPQRCDLTFTVPSWAPFYVPVCRLALRRLAALAASPHT